ncbi:MAG: hypothetical protein JWO38_6591 [Gemmataceae bacterium]|nr:hypothetical protein [Gemmataceae bacterium]
MLKIRWAGLLAALSLLPAGCKKSNPDLPSGGNDDAAPATEIRIEIPGGAPRPETKPTAKAIDDLATVPAIEGGVRLLAAGKFEPEGAQFPGGLKVTWPLKEARPAGSPLYIVTLVPAENKWRWTGETATVAADGGSAAGTVWHFSDIGLGDGPPPGDPVLGQHAVMVRLVRLATAHHVIPGADVEIAFPNGAEAKVAKTDAAGRAVFPVLPGQAGKYRVKVSHPDFEAKTVPFEKLFETTARLQVELKALRDAPAQVHKFRLVQGEKVAEVSFADPVFEISDGEAQIVRQKEADFYTPKAAGSYQWLLAADGTEVKARKGKLPGYVVAQNRPTNKQICGSIPLSLLFGGPFRIPTGTAWEVVQKFGVEVSAAEQGDVVVFKAGDTVNHFAFVADVQESPIILTKDETGLVWYGHLDKFPRDYGRASFYRIDWDNVDVFRLDDQPPRLLTSAIGTNEITGAPGLRLQKSMIGAADEISGLLGVNKYTLTGGSLWVQTGDSGRNLNVRSYGTRWKRLEDPAKPGSSPVFDCGIGLRRYRDAETSKFVYDADPTAARDYKRDEFEEVDLLGEKVLRFKPAHLGKVKRKADEIGIGFDEMQIWRVGPYVWQVTVRVNAPGRGPEAERLYKVAREHASGMLKAVIRHSKESILDAPERPAEFPGRRP